jgi:hypothetical protein
MAESVAPEGDTYLVVVRRGVEAALHAFTDVAEVDLDETVEVASEPRVRLGVEHAEGQQVVAKVLEVVTAEVGEEAAVSLKHADHCRVRRNAALAREAAELVDGYALELHQRSDEVLYVKECLAVEQRPR